MTEAEWLAVTDAAPMLGVARRDASERKLRLFAAACCRSVWHRLSDWRSRRVVEVAERYADGEAPREDVTAAREAIPDGRRFGSAAVAKCVAQFPAGHAAASTLHMLRCLVAFTDYGPHSPRVSDVSLPVAAAAMRDIFGNPFRPVTFCPSWRTSTAAALAAGMYEARDFGAMPILADALQDAGCDTDDILDHCRGGGPHVRGCWVVDLVLGKG
ncbi:hypothetical protein R5W23_003380 [Gemmata sp. JC673]|uniref:SMI1/KNR4 family protein n=1 Tax=Gemmata algarum TaxID=2975278 RepID=A0ABU5F3N8_9BACT|nr:hypothetical protein [Gemmata algarum]MDY3561950.1 hypothetical protein [Gemmata algarum]